MSVSHKTARADLCEDLRIRMDTTAVAFPAFAQTTTEYYVVQDTTTKRCTIVDKKPTTTTMVQVGPATFKTRTEAETGMKTIKVCETK